MFLVGEAWQIIIGLGFKIGTGYAATGLGLKQGQPRIFGEGMDKGGNKDSLSRLR